MLTVLLIVAQALLAFPAGIAAGRWLRRRRPSLRAPVASTMHRCACGVARDRAAWDQLRFVGFQDDYAGGGLALRWCDGCGTVAVPAFHDVHSSRRVLQ